MAFCSPFLRLQDTNRYLELMHYLNEGARDVQLSPLDVGSLHYHMYTCCHLILLSFPFLFVFVSHFSLFLFLMMLLLFTHID